MDRITARTQAMKLIYEWEMGGDGGDDTRLNLLEVQPDENEADYMNRMFEGVVANVDAIDAELKKYVRGWSLDRVTRVDLAILRLAAYEIKAGDAPGPAVINAAVELANQYSTEKAGAFVNGVLGSLLRGEAPEESK